MPRHRPITDFSAIFRELQHENARVVAIVGGALLDNILTTAILARMRPISSTMQEDLFEGYGPLSTFSAKADVGYALGLYEEDVRKDLRTLNRIRNKFAHDL